MRRSGKKVEGRVRRNSEGEGSDRGYKKRGWVSRVCEFHETNLQ